VQDSRSCVTKTDRQQMGTGSGKASLGSQCDGNRVTKNACARRSDGQAHKHRVGSSIICGRGQREPLRKSNNRCCQGE
jgi:hypothetical protein